MPYVRPYYIQIITNIPDFHCVPPVSVSLANARSPIKYLINFFWGWGGGGGGGGVGLKVAMVCLERC